MKTGIQSVGLVVFVAIELAGLAQAAIQYGDFDGTTVMYLDVTETANSKPGSEPLLGPPTLTDNQLDFDPQGLVATSTGGPFDINDAQLNFSIDTGPGHGLTGLEISEFGDYSLTGSGGVETTVTAAVGIWIEILAVDFQPLVDPFAQHYSASFTTDLATEGQEVVLAPWSLSLFVDFETLLGSTFQYGVTDAQVVIDNQLITNSELDSLAFIAKKDFKLIPKTTINPEPATVVVMLLGGLLIARRRS